MSASAQSIMACKCISCSQPLPKSSSRRRVGATVSSHLLPEIKNSVRAVFPDEVALEVFLPRDIDTTGSVFLCRGCFQHYEKLQKLNRTIINLRKEIQADIEKSGNFLGLRPIAAAVISEPQKSSADDIRATLSRIKRRTANTSERCALSENDRELLQRVSL